MRTIPNMTVVAPCDALEASKALEEAIHQNGSTYMRFFGGTGIPTVHLENVDFELDKAITLREGNDLAILACGSMVKQALQTAEALSEQGIESEVIDVHTIKPFDVAVLDNCNKKKLIVTIEEHRLIGGLGSVVSMRLKERQIATPLLHIGVDETYPMPGSYPYMLKQCGLTVEQIKNQIIDKIS